MRGRIAKARWAVEALEVRALLTAAPSNELLIKVGANPPAELAPIAGPNGGVSIQPSGLPDVVIARGDSALLGQLANSLAGKQGIGYVEPIGTLRVSKTPNDPKFTDGTLWGLNGSFGINAPAAWDVTTGSNKVVIADIDTGLTYDHPDLYQNVWINQQEIPASRRANLSDVDGDGLITFYDLNNSVNQGPGKITDLDGDGRIDAGDILKPTQKDAGGADTGLGGWSDGISQDGDTAHLDDLIGWNFVNNTNNPLDDHGHGTHTAGTIAAMGNNGVGVVGVNWTAQIMPLKFIAANGEGSDLDAALAERYATDHGVRVSSNSYGGGDGGTDLSDAIAYAGTKGGVFIAAAGNDGKDTDASANYPSAYPNDNIVAVAAIASDGTLAGFSNYGATTVDIGAPGVNITSTVPGGYGASSGTSMATPHVAGAVGLVLAQHPTWTYTQIIQAILGTARPDAALAGKSVSGGILNVGAALGVQSSSSASFVGQDTTTQGSWKGVYGADGYQLVGDATSLPSYAVVTPSGPSSFTWAASTTDVRALQKAASTTDRIASTWYASPQFSVDVNLTDGQAHRVTMYAVDWDRNTGRSERVDVLDAATGAVLDTRTLSSFVNGSYLSWTLSGHVALRFTNLAGPNAVVGALFFDAKPPAAASALTVSAPSSATAGTPFNVTVTARDSAGAAVAGYTGTVHFTSTDGQAALPADYTFTAADAGVHTFSVTLRTPGAQTVTATDRATSTIAGTASVTVNAATSASFLGQDATTQGTWKGSYGADGYQLVGDAKSLPSYATVTPSGQSSWTWAASTTDTRALQKAASGSTDRLASTWYSGSSFSVDVNLTDGQTHRVSLYALDWDRNGRSERVDVLDAATGAVLDTRTLSAFAGGSYLSWTLSGHVVLKFANLGGANAVVSGLFFDPSGPVAATRLSVSAPSAAAPGTPFNVTVTARGASGSTATAYTGTVHFTSSDSLAGLPADYTFTAADAGVHTFSVTLRTPGAQTVAAADVASSSIAGTAGVNVVAGASASFVGQDTTTQGSWKGVYGANGAQVIGDSTSLPAYATVAPSGQSSWTWAASTTDVRGLQKGAATATDRIASTWYSSSQFGVDLNLTDGQAHRVSLYAVDWDRAGRSERVDVLDATTGAVLDTRTLSAFTGGSYLTWNLSGHVVLRFTRTAGANAVLSGLFFDNPA